MTETLTATSRTAAATIRAYRPTDHRDCRQLWAGLAQEREVRYGAAPDPVDDDPGAEFEEYLTRLDLSGMWVAEDVGRVVGFVGLLLDGRGGQVDPVVVVPSRRGEGIGRSLLGHVAEQARSRGLRGLTISPDARNVNAIHCLYAAGYDAVSRVTLEIDLTTDRNRRQDGPDLYGRRFRH